MTAVAWQPCTRAATAQMPRAEGRGADINIRKRQDTAGRTSPFIAEGYKVGRPQPSEARAVGRRAPSSAWWPPACSTDGARSRTGSSTSTKGCPSLPKTSRNRRTGGDGPGMASISYVHAVSGFSRTGPHRRLVSRRPPIRIAEKRSQPLDD